MARLTKVFCAVCTLFLSICAAATSPISVQPSAFNYGNQYLNKQYPNISFRMANNGTTAVSLASFSISGPFRWRSGLAPQRISPGTSIAISIQFWPTVPGPASGTATFNFNNGVPSVNVPLTGTGLLTTAAISYSVKEVVFTNQAVGSSVSKTLKLTNSGAASLVVSIAIITPSVFSIGATKFPATLMPGSTLNLPIIYAPTLPGTQRGTISFVFNNLPWSGVGLSGTAKPATSLTLATTSPIPGDATRSAFYSYALNAAGGIQPYTWNLMNGSLPQGLTLTSHGVISGTVSATATGTTFTVSVHDAGSQSASRNLTLNVDPVSTAACSNANWNIAGTGSPEVPLDVLGTGNYMGYIGGLYPGGVNTMPNSHLQDGINIANSIQPLDANGNPSPSGKYALLSLGTSDANYEFERYLQYASNESTINSNLVIVEGAMGSEALDTMLGPNGKDFWSNIYTWSFPEAGATPQQVVAIWMEPEDAHPPGQFPLDAEQIHNELRKFLPDLQVRFPNLKLLYLASRAYAGYANPTKVVTEPYSYDQAYGLQATIADQINGDPTLNFDPNAGPVVAPWLAWDSYKWGNGMTAHKGLVWACPDFDFDGYHVTIPGEDKFSGLLMNFLKSDPTSAPWFYAP